MFFTRGVNLRFRTVVIKKLTTILKPKTVIWMENRLGNRNFEMAKLFIQPLKNVNFALSKVVLKTIVGSVSKAWTLFALSTEGFKLHIANSTL